MNEHLVIEDLMTIDRRRQDGSLTAPHMRWDYLLRGPMALKVGTITEPEWLAVEGNVLSINGMPLGFAPRL